MMTTSELQKLALSQLVYSPGLSSAHDSWTIDGLIRAGVIEDASYSDTLGTYTFSPQLSILSTMLDWTLVDFESNPNGFAGAAFKTPSSELIFAFRGTELFSNGLLNGLKDIEQDINIAMNEETSGQTQFDDAFDFWTSVLQSQGSGTYSGYSFTGHSLGGALAQYMTYMTNEVGHSVTFNAVGIGQSIEGVNPSDYNDSIVDYVNENDIIGMYGIQLGQTKYIDDHGGYVFNSAIDTYQLALKTSILGAMQKGQIDQARGIAALNGLLEVGQIIANANLNVYFGAHKLDTFFTTVGSTPTEVSGPNLAIQALTKALQFGFTVTESVVDGVTRVVVEIPFELGAATAKVSIGIVNGGAQVSVTIGNAIWNWLGAIGQTLEDIRNDTATLFGNLASEVDDVREMLYQTLFGNHAIIEGTGGDGLNLSAPNVSESIIINGLAGDDSITGSNMADILDGGAGNDTIYGLYGDDYIYGRDGDDILYGGYGNDVLIGGAGNDILRGDDGDDIIIGGRGDDYLYGGLQGSTFARLTQVLNVS